MKYYLAVDIGASSGRHMLGWVANGRIHTEEIYRFENNPVNKDGHRCWDIEGLFGHILAGMKAAGEANRVPESVGVDTWAVDYVLLDREGNRMGSAVAYRDKRTQGMDKLLESEMPFSELYGRTGIQKLVFNTVYQLMAHKREWPDQLANAQHFLMLPDYFHYRLSGVVSNEYTNATSTAMVNADGKDWDDAILKQLGVPRRLFQPLATPGTDLGPLTEAVAKQVGFSCRVVLPATHDTASAYLATPARDAGAVYLSSGTWSLLGVEVPRPVITPAGQAANFTNEGGYEYQYRLLKNIMGLWMIQSIRRETEQKPSYAELEEAAKAVQSFTSLVDVNDDIFLAPETMSGAVRQMCRTTGQPVPDTLGELMYCVYHSLAKSYADSIRELSGITGKAYTSINIVGGGSKDGYLNQLTANATGLPVYAGPQEGTVIGNLLAQMLAAGEFPGRAAARRAVAESFDVTEVQPANQ